ncbi:hypothetical protein DIPPA_21281 [Diplonema papillatum]|nr:hypothetical protein DIPPA_21281 [Diplonema papillatum]
MAVRSGMAVRSEEMPVFPASRIHYRTEPLPKNMPSTTRTEPQRREWTASSYFSSSSLLVFFCGGMLVAA